MVRRTTDELFMTQALELARQGVGLASPNPCVGAIVVDEVGRIVGRGVHKYADRKHAEVIALEEAGGLARGNTLYLNLEPCCHTGKRTGPCTEAILAAGVGRVVAAMSDPNPQVSGRGFDRLRRAGVEVSEGVLQHEARKLNEAFARFIRTDLPFVTLKSAMTLDGKIAAAPSTAAGKGSTTYITGVQALRQVHRLRHAADAILVGVGTILADDPLLTDRSELPRRRPLLRVILDSHLRTPVDSRIVASAADDVVVFCTDAAGEKRRALEARGIRVEQLSHPSKPTAGLPGTPAPPDVATHAPCLQPVLARLAKLHIVSLLVEGGATVNWAFLQAGLADKIWLFYAPKILGSDESTAFASGGFRTMAEALRIHDISLHRYAEDWAVEGYFRDPYA